MNTPRLSELALAFSLVACSPRPPEAMATVRNDTNEAIQKAIETPLSEVDQLIAEMETALKELQAPPCEPPDGPRKARLKAAIKKSQDYLATKGIASKITNLNCEPVILGAIVEILKSQLEQTEHIPLAQN